MKKAERLELEARTTYSVCKAAPNVGHTHEIRRKEDGKMKALYYVTLTYSHGGAPKVIWCDCAGFKRQKYAHMEHKHIKLAVDYNERVPDDYGEAITGVYQIHGTGANAEIEFSHMHTQGVIA